MRTRERDHSLTLTRRRFVQGVAAVGIAAVVEGKINQADAEIIDHSPSVLTGNHFDLTIEPHHVDFTGRRAKAIKINGSLPGPTLKWREGETVTVAVTNHLPVMTSIHWHGVRTELAADLPQVMGDRVQLQQVLMNLMMNSIDAMKDVDGTRELTINSQRGENEQLVVSVSDTGVGLPPQQADQIFNAFFTTKPHGTGMGLRISRSIVESHGGRLWAADNSSRGASFHLSLPTKVEAHE